MAEKYLDNSGVVRLLQGINTFTNNAFKSISTKMVEVEGQENVELAPNSITKVTLADSGNLHISFGEATKDNAKYILTFTMLPTTNLTYADIILWDRELACDDISIVKIDFNTYDGGESYQANYKIYPISKNRLYYKSSDASIVEMPAFGIFGDYDASKYGVIEYEFDVDFIPYHILNESKVVTDAFVLHPVSTLQAGAFNNNTSLQKVTIPGVKSLGESAFHGSTNLQEINIGNSVAYIGINAFKNTKYYDNLPDGDVYIGTTYYGYKGTMPANTTLTIREGTTSISHNAFVNQTNLVGINIPSSVSQIGNTCFSGCTSLNTINVGNALLNIDSFTFASTPTITYGTEYTTNYTSVREHFVASGLYGLDVPNQKVLDSTMWKYLNTNYYQTSGSINFTLIVDSIEYSTDFIYDSARNCYIFNSLDGNFVIEVLDSEELFIIPLI